MPDELEQLATELTNHGLAVPFNLSAGQSEAVLEHLFRWPTPEAAIAAFVAVAEAGVKAYDLPRTARAWVPFWLEVRPPSATSLAALVDVKPCGNAHHEYAGHTSDGQCIGCVIDRKTGRAD